MGIAALPDDHVGGGGVDDVPAVRGLDFRNDVGTGCEIAYPDFPLTVGGENAVGGEGGRADHTVQPHLTARRRGDAELGPRQDGVGLAVPLLDDELATGLIFEGEDAGAALFDLDGLRLGVDEEASRGLDLGDDDALARFQPLDADLPVLVGSENAIGIADHGAVRVGDLKLGVLQGNAGIGGAHLPHKKEAVRHIVEADRHHGLLPVVCQEHRLGGIDDGVPVRRVHLLHDVGPRLQPGPHGNAIFPCYLLANDSAARAAAPRQIAELEGASGQGLARHAVVLLDNDTIFRGVLKGDGVILARRQIDLLGVRLFDGVAGGGFQLLDFVPARVHPLQVDLALRVGVEGAQVVVFAGLGIVRTAPDLELHALNGTARDGVHLFNEQVRLAQVAQFQGGGLVFLQIDGVDGIIRHPAVFGFDLLDSVRAGV